MSTYTVKIKGIGFDRVEFYGSAYDAYKAYKSYVFADMGELVFFCRDGITLLRCHCDATYKFETRHYYDADKHGIRYCDYYDHGDEDYLDR